MGDVYMVNGKILSGLPNHAKDIEFDNTGTTLQSNNVQDAIVEASSSGGSSGKLKYTGNGMSSLETLAQSLTVEQLYCSTLVTDYSGIKVILHGLLDLSTSVTLAAFAVGSSSIEEYCVNLPRTGTGGTFNQYVYTGSRQINPLTMGDWTLFVDSNITAAS